MRGDEADQQYRDRRQTQQAGKQRRPVTAAQLGIADLVVRRALHVGHQAAHLIEGLAEWVVFQQRQVLVAGCIDLLQKAGIGAGDGLECLPIGLVAGFGDAALERLLERLTQRFQRVAAPAVGEHHDQVVAQRLSQLLVDLDDGEVVADQLFLALGHLHDADQRQQQAQQRNRHQRGEAEKQAGPQLHLEFHRPYCLRFR